MHDLKDQIGELVDRGATPVSVSEVSERHAAAAPPIRREPRWPGRRRVVIWGVTAGVAVAGCAAALVIVPAHPARPGAHLAGPATRTAGPSRHSPAFLTVAMVQHLAAASRSALANSGQERISYRSAQNGAVTSYGTDIVTFSGSDWNYAVHKTQPGSEGKPATITDGIARVVNGQLYLQPDVTAAKSPWLHELGAHNGAHFPEPRSVLQLLSPRAKFQVVGWEVIGGIRLQHLRATQVSGLPDDLTLSRYAPAGEPLSGLDLWADNGGVVQQMRIELTGADGQTTLTVVFSGFGRPEVITVPQNAIPVSS